MYFPRNWEIGSALSKLRGLNPPNPLPLDTPLQNIYLFPKSKLVYSRSSNRNCNVLRTERQTAVRITDTSHHITSHHITSHHITSHHTSDDRTIWFRLPVPGRSAYLPFRHLGPKQPAVQWLLATFPRGESSQNVIRTQYNLMTPLVTRDWCCTSISLYASYGAKDTLFMYLNNNKTHFNKMKEMRKIHNRC
jgi:hypothetical protein